jgi:isopentenyl-diphosphate Delta-isomerase
MFYEPSNNDNQQLAIVSEQDNIIGSALPEKIYYQGLLHRFASIFILDNQSRLLLQKRAFNKNRHAGLFSESVSAQVTYSEKYIDAALRRINEELGLVLEEHGLDASSGTRLTQVCKMNDRLSINPYEISNAYFLSLDKVLEFFNSSPSLFVPGLDLH